MGKVSEVEIAGHKYRYEYQDGETVYIGPVGDGPSLSEEEFMKEINKTKMTQDEMERAALHLEVYATKYYPPDAELGPILWLMVALAEEDWEEGNHSMKNDVLMKIDESRWHHRRIVSIAKESIRHYRAWTKS